MANNKMPSIDPDDVKGARSPELEGGKAADQRNNPMGQGYRNADGEDVGQGERPDDREYGSRDTKIDR